MPAGMSTVYQKDPLTTRSYTLDWANDLTYAPGITITASTWEVPADLTNEGDDHSDTTTEIKLSGGLLNTYYTLYNLITTSDALTNRRAFVLQVLDAALISEPSKLEEQLAAVRVALGEKAAKDTWEYQIANRMKREHTFEDLLRWEQRLTELVNQERRAKGGSGFFKNHYVRPTEPGP
jgi:hypothetical protein